MRSRASREEPLMKLRVLCATIVAMLASAGAAGAHEIPGGFSFQPHRGLLRAQRSEGRRACEAASQMRKPADREPRGASARTAWPPSTPAQRRPARLGAAARDGRRERLGNDIWGWTDPVTGTSARSSASTTAPRSSTSPTRRARLRRQPADHTRHQQHLARHPRLQETTPTSSASRRPRDAGLRPHPAAQRRAPPAMTFTADARLHRRRQHPQSRSTRTPASPTWSAPTPVARRDGGLHMVDIRNPLNPTFAGCILRTRPTA